ncbi:unnamed protein product [Blepharisma stoltei]|uniref:Uncharacterized protein n=1 Tax=Blepharisma stoltei TaxID=1481888 RepID=A0AAU9JH65_9CILI|nr:unnamed protein product [Blepharisma stoltei]
MPSGTPCYYSSALYFDRSVFCFGGSNGNHLALSERFDFNQNCWIKLAALPKADIKCHCIILNGNILIAG